jgi:hypothetical protein
MGRVDGHWQNGDYTEGKVILRIADLILHLLCIRAPAHWIAGGQLNE